MTTYIYKAGDNVMYNSKCSTIFKQVENHGTQNFIFCSIIKILTTQGHFLYI